MPTKPGYYSRKLDELRASFGGRCVDCGSRRKLEFSHVRPTTVYGRGRGQSVRYHDVKRHPRHYALRCRRCHRRFDHADALAFADQVAQGAA